MTKFYAVKNGRKTGIFKTWAECQAQVSGYSNAKYKSFNNYEDAENYLLEQDENKQSITESNTTKNEEITYKTYAFIDGSYDSKTKVYGSGIVIVHNNQKEYYNFANNNSNIASLHNVAGELEAAKFVLNYALKNHLSDIAIYYDYRGIADWATGDWKANLDYTKEYATFAQNIMRKINVYFVKVKAHSGNKLNDMVDKLAKDAIIEFNNNNLKQNSYQKSTNIEQVIKQDSSNINNIEITDDFYFGDGEDRILIEKLKNRN